MCHQVDYGYEQHSYHALHHCWHHRWGCCCRPGYASRRFPTREEIIRQMEDYLKQLKAEAKQVEERIAGLRKEG